MLLAVNVTSYTPASLYSWVGDSAVLVLPSPKSQLYSVASTDKFRQNTGWLAP